MEVSISARQLESGSDLTDHLKKIAQEEQTKYEKKKRVGPGGIDWAKEAKTFVDEKVETVKAAVSRRMEDENIAAMKSRAELYYTTAKDNVEPAKIVLGNIAANAKAGITEKGYIGFAQVLAASFVLL